MKNRIKSLFVIAFVSACLAGCATSWKLGPEQEEAIKHGADTGKVVGALTGLPGGSDIGGLIGAGIAALGTAFGVYKHGKDKGWDEAAGKPATPGAAVKPAPSVGAA